MGLLGSLTAWQLHRHGIEFTWNDNDSPITAWKACTGACYPSGGELDQTCYKQWRLWAPAGIYPKDTIEVCQYWVDTVNRALPHGLDVEVRATAGPLRLVGQSVHVNAQKLVRLTRERFSNQQVDFGEGQQVVSHGFSQLRQRFLWGWTRLIRLAYSDEIAVHGRPSLYLRKNRFQFAYCYPRPGGDWWYAGSNLISQKVAQPLEMESKYAGWKERFLELTGGQVQIVEEGALLEGWRPSLAGGLSETEGAAASRTMLTRQDGMIYFPVLASAGFRHFPAVWQELRQVLGK